MLGAQEGEEGNRKVEGAGSIKKVEITGRLSKQLGSKCLGNKLKTKTCG